MRAPTSVFRSTFAETIFNNKYRHEGAETWEILASTLVRQVCGKYMKPHDVDQLVEYVAAMKFIPGGRYLYYAGRPNAFWNNCYLFRSEEDTREDWAMTSWKHESALMTGGGTGNDYSRYRAAGTPIKRTGGTASGPIPKMQMTNEIGRRVMQGGSRRSAIYASLSAEHADAWEFLRCKDWDKMEVKGTGDLSIGDLKRADFNYPAPMDMTNISLNWGDAWLKRYRKTGDVGELFMANARQALKTAEPGMSFNFGAKANETLRNACTEVTSEDDSDVCNLGSVNMSRIETIGEFNDVVRLATMFLICGTLEAKLPYEKVYKVREKNRRLGLGIMGVHEWLIQRGYRYEVTPELAVWLNFYRAQSDTTSWQFADELGISRPVANRAIAPTGTIGLMRARQPGSSRSSQWPTSAATSRTAPSGTTSSRSTARRAS
jgi:ribonucleoside-diphosphate reductase alpha chain